jgi:hypothetical protein
VRRVRSPICRILATCTRRQCPLFLHRRVTSGMYTYHTLSFSVYEGVRARRNVQRRRALSAAPRSAARINLIDVWRARARVSLISHKFSGLSRLPKDFNYPARPSTNDNDNEGGRGRGLFKRGSAPRVRPMRSQSVISSDPDSLFRILSKCLQRPV